MLDILAITSPIYIIIALGYFTTRAGLFARLEMRTFGKFVINLALPALVFNAITSRHISDIFHPGYLVAYLGGSLLVLAFVYQFCLRGLRIAPTKAAVCAMGTCSSNSSFIGYPILLLTLAPVASVALAMNVVIENVIMLPLLLTMAEAGQGVASGGKSWGQALRESLARLPRNPLVMSLAAGLLLSLLEWQVPAPLSRTITIIAHASGALSLFVIGGTLVGLQMRGLARKVAPIVFSKLVLHPLAVALLIACLPWLGVTPLDSELRAAAVMMAAMPMMSIYPILSQAYGFEDRSAAALVLATMTSFLTLSGLIWLLG